MTGVLQVRGERTGEVFPLDPGLELGAGGQARVYALRGNGTWVAKVYHRPPEEMERKLRVMLDHPPAEAALRSGRPGLAWPVDLLRDRTGRHVGVLLPRVEGMHRVFELYNPASRRRLHPLCHYGLLHEAAGNLAAAFHSLHAAGYVVGDVNESNVLVDAEGRVTLIDTDSFQVTDPATGAVYRCPVGRPEFTPRELRGRSLAEVDRAPHHDRFGLAVLVFEMLMEGTHPFAGRFEGAGDPPSLQERIAEGHFPYARHTRVPYPPSRAAPLPCAYNCARRAAP